MNFMVCKIGVAAGTATTGDVIVVPFTMSGGFPETAGRLASYRKPGRSYNTGSNGLWGANLLGIAACIAANKGTASA